MRKENRKGDAMIVVLCIMTILVTLCLSMLLASSVLINNAQKKAAQEQCRVSAVTMSQVMEADLGSKGDELNFNVESGLYLYVQLGIGKNGEGVDWPYYNPDEIGHGETSPNIYRNFTSDSFHESTTGDIEVRLYWEWDSYSKEHADMDKITLHVDVTAKKQGQQHTVFSTYSLDVLDDAQKTWTWTLVERS